MRDTAGTSDNFRILELQWVPSKHQRRLLFNFWGLFSLQGKNFQWRRDKGVWKRCCHCGSSLINSACNWSQSVCLLRERSCCSRCYNRLLRYKRALDRVGETENEIKPDFTNDGPFWVIRLIKESARGEKKLKVWRCKCKQQSIPMYHAFPLQALLCLPYSLLVLLALLLH